MNLNFKALAVVVIIMGFMVVGGYMLGTQQASNEIASKKAQPLTNGNMLANELEPGAQVPLNHPQMDAPAPAAAVPFLSHRHRRPTLRAEAATRRHRLRSSPVIANLLISASVIAM